MITTTGRARGAAHLLDNWQETDERTHIPYRVVIEEAHGRVNLFVNTREEVTLAVATDEAERERVYGVLAEHYPQGWAQRFRAAVATVDCDGEWSRIVRELAEAGAE